MTDLVIDASIAIKWVIGENDSAAALALRQRYRLMAPDLLVPECANVLWKKVQRRELSRDEALLTARLLEVSDVELVAMRNLLESATRLALALDHAAYDCVYLALALDRDCRFVTADKRLAGKVALQRDGGLRNRVFTLSEAAS